MPALDLPGARPLFPEGFAPWKSQPQRDETIDHPGNRHQAHQQQTPVVGQGQVVMKFQNERDEVLRLKAAFPPVAMPGLFTTHGVQVKHLIWLFERLARDGVVAWHCCEQRGVPPFIRVLHVPDLKLGMLPLQPVDQHARRELHAFRGSLVERWIQPFIQLMIERQKTAGQASHQQKQGRGQTDVTMKQNPYCTHDIFPQRRQSQHLNPDAGFEGVTKG
ncbi:hypothetical protein D3C78_1010700 [compost metagenome]